MKRPISDIIESVITKVRKPRKLKFTNIEDLLISATYPTERAATFNVSYVTFDVISSLTGNFSYDVPFSFYPVLYTAMYATAVFNYLRAQSSRVPRPKETHVY